MFGKKAKKKAEEDAARKEALFTQQLQKADKPDPVVDFLKQGNLDFLKEIQGPGFDVTKSKAMAPYVAMGNFDRAAAEQEQDKMGTGLLQMGAQGSNPALASLIKQNRADRATQQRGGALERAFAGKYGEATGSALPLANFDQSRNLTLTGMLGGQAENAQNRWAQMAMQPGFLEKMLLGGMQGAAGVGSAYLGRDRG